VLVVLAVKVLNAGIRDKFSEKQATFQALCFFCFGVSLDLTLIFLARIPLPAKLSPMNMAMLRAQAHLLPSFFIIRPPQTAFGRCWRTATNWVFAGERDRPGCRFRRRAENRFPN
jgi:hypothetical protein